MQQWEAAAHEAATSWGMNYEDYITEMRNFVSNNNSFQDRPSSISQLTPNLKPSLDPEKNSMVKYNQKQFEEGRYSEEEYKQIFRNMEHTANTYPKFSFAGR